MVAGLAALLLAGRRPVAPPAPAPIIEAVKAVDVLIARTDIPMGQVLSTKEVGWVSWPEQFAGGPYIRRTDRPGALEEINGAIARYPFVANEPIRDEKLIRGATSGFLSAILPEGKRAVAISIDSRGSATAGGFILPNDHVDVIATHRDNEASERTGADAYVSKTILKNVRVLAIGQRIQEKDGEKTVIGETATLELEPAQAEDIVLHQRQGSLSLALRAYVDISKPDAANERADRGLTVIRYGIVQEAVRP